MPHTHAHISICTKHTVPCRLDLTESDHLPSGHSSSLVPGNPQKEFLSSCSTRQSTSALQVGKLHPYFQDLRPVWSDVSAPKPPGTPAEPHDTDPKSCPEEAGLQLLPAPCRDCHHVNDTPPIPPTPSPLSLLLSPSPVCLSSLSLCF